MSQNDEHTDDERRSDDAREPFDPAALAEYKKRKAVGFVERGYSVEWVPDADNWMGVYTPERPNERRAEIRAEVKFFRDPSQHGIHEGRISKLSIQARRTDLIAKVMGKPYESVSTLYNFDRGPDVDRLASNPEASRLFCAVLEELN